MRVNFLLALPLLAADFATDADELVRKHRLSGAVSVAKDGKPVLRKGYGLANAEWDIPNTPDTKFRIGSITKQFTAVAILQLVEQGKLKLDDPIARHYDGAPAAWEKVTIHHLLNHTSGIPSYTNIKGFFQSSGSRNPLTSAEIVKITQDKPLEFEPGSQYNYNDSAFVLLGHLVEKLSGMKYDAYLREKILTPAGLTDTGYDWTGTVLRKRASGYSPDGTNTTYLDMTLPHGAGAMYSTVDDMVQWDRALIAGKLIGKESWTKMTTPGRSNYGYGLIIKTIAGHNSQSHGGGINGFNTHFMRFPDDGVVIAVFSNVNGPVADKLCAELAQLYFKR
jgi:D-alanyl-D-alanine carboxypeptidase